MKKIIPFLFFFLAQTAFAQLPLIRSNIENITYSVNGKPTGNTWTITPSLKPDVLGYISDDKVTTVVFYTDVDSMVCKVKPGKSFQFYILLNGKDSALTQVSITPKPPKPASFNKDYIARNKGKSSFEIPEVQELVHIVMALTPTGIENGNLVQHYTDYYKEVMAHFDPWKDHPAVKAMDNGLSNFYGHLKMDACGYVFKGNKLRKDGTYNRLSWDSRNYIEPMVKDLEDFAKKSDFRAFFKRHKDFYAARIAEAEKYMPVAPQWSWCEQQFPNRYDNYRITFSPLVNGWHCTNRFEDNGFKQTVMFICDAHGKGPDMPEAVWEGLMTRVVLTEIDHNYVNPVSDQYMEQIGKIFDKRIFWVNESMASSYNSPYSVFNEYMTWAVFSLYALDRYDKTTFETINARVEKQMVEWRGFTKFREFNQKLISLYKERPSGKKVYELYPEMLAWSERFCKEGR